MSLDAVHAAAPLDTLLEPVPFAGEAMEIEDDTPRTVHLGPQRLPDASSGLEDLFEKSLALDVPPLREHPWHWTTSNLPLLALGLVFGSVLGLALFHN